MYELEFQVVGYESFFKKCLIGGISWHEFSLSLSVRKKLLTHQRYEQSGFTPKKSTVDRILALRVLTDLRLRDFRIGLLAAYVDLTKAFDSVN